MTRLLLLLTPFLLHASFSAAVDDRACWEHETDRGARSFVRESVAVDGSQTWSLYWSNGVKTPLEFIDETEQFIELRSPTEGNRLRLFDDHGKLQKFGEGPFRKFSDGGWNDRTELAALKLNWEDGFVEAGLKLRRLLELGQYAEIERRLDADLDSKKRAPGDNSFAWLTFDEMIDDDRPSDQLRLAVQWIQVDPRSAYGLSAAAWAQTQVAWKIRGNAYTSKTDQQKLERFSRAMKTVRHNLDRALRISPKNPIVLYVHMCNLRHTGGDDDEHRAAFETVISVDKNFLPAYLERRARLDPKWGGNVKEMVTFSKTHLERADELPGFHILAHYAHRSLAELSSSEETYYQSARIFDGVRTHYEALILAYPAVDLYHDWYRKTAEYADRVDEAEAFLASLEQ